MDCKNRINRSRFENGIICIDYCENCGRGITQSEVEDGRMVEELLERVNEDESCEPLSPWTEGNSFDATLDWACPNCSETGEVKANVAGNSPMWDNDRDVPSFMGYEDVSINFSPLDPSPINHGPRFNGYTEDGELCFILNGDLPTVPVSLRPTVPVSLCILAKTNMNKGYCYIGYSQEDDCLVRPIYRTKQNTCCWDNDMKFDVERWYGFMAFKNQEEICSTNYPHRLNDVVVVGECVPGEEYGDELTKKLLPHCKNGLNAVFDNKLISVDYKPYVLEGEQCTSVGMFHVPKSEFKIEFVENKPRMFIGGSNCPITMCREDLEMAMKSSSERFLVIVGLGRGFSCKWFPDEKRCYVLIVGMIPL